MSRRPSDRAAFGPTPPPDASALDMVRDLARIAKETEESLTALQGFINCPPRPCPADQGKPEKCDESLMAQLKALIATSSANLATAQDLEAAIGK